MRRRVRSSASSTTRSAAARDIPCPARSDIGYAPHGRPIFLLWRHYLSAKPPENASAHDGRPVARRPHCLAAIPLAWYPRNGTSAALFGARAKPLETPNQWTRVARLRIHAPADAATMTRDCVDPWTYAEITAAGDIRPCCKFRPLAKLDEVADVGSVRNNEKFRALRQGLLSGNLDPICQECHFRKSVPTAKLNRKVAAAARRARRNGCPASAADHLLPHRHQRKLQSALRLLRGLLADLQGRRDERLRYSSARSACSARSTPRPVCTSTVTAKRPFIRNG